MVFDNKELFLFTVKCAFYFMLGVKMGSHDLQSTSLITKWTVVFNCIVDVFNMFCEIALGGKTRLAKITLEGFVTKVVIQMCLEVCFQSVSIRTEGAC